MKKTATALKSKSLNPQSFVDAALAVIDEVGVDKLSMRKVAQRLDVSPMAMYKHFPNKEELLVAAFDEFIARADVIPHDELPWDAYLTHVGRRMYTALCNEQGWMPYLGALGGGAQASVVTDAVAKRLCAEGFSVNEAVTAYYALIQIVVGAACLHSSFMSKAGTVAGSAQESLAKVTRVYLANADHQSLKIAPELDSVAGVDQIDIALPLVIEALKQRL